MNDKLLKWAGFTCKNNLWCYPDGIEIEGNPPNFKSLDDCFEWLVPKVYDMELYKVNRFEGEWQTAYSARVRLARKHWTDTITRKDPALALCLAIEKLIGG